MNENNSSIDTDALKEKLQELIQKGNVSRVRIRRGEKTILNVPVTAGVAGGVLGMLAAPWALIAGTVATLGLDCAVDVIKEDGEVICLTETELGRRAASAGHLVMGSLKNILDGVVAGLNKNLNSTVIESIDYHVEDEDEE